MIDQAPEQPFDARWDPHPDALSDYLVDPSGLTGEDAKGVWTRVHPDVLLLHEPKLWDVVDEWSWGLRKITRQDLETKSAFELEARAVLAAATAREERRYIRGERDDTDPEA